MARRVDRADNGLLADNYRRLNDRFYGGKPWVYFERRLMNLALLVGDPERYHAALSEPITLGQLVVQESRRDLAPDEPVGLDDQSFSAAEAQVVLHHVAETLLRLCDAHAPRSDGAAPPSPWLELSRRQGPGEFKEWVREAIHEAPREDVDELSRFLFGNAVARGRTQDLGDYLRLFAEHFLDAASYNAAKHGFALQGARSQLRATVEDIDLIDDEGLTIQWLAVWGEPPRWTRTTRWFSVEATIGVAFVAGWMIRALWLAARERYLNDPVSEAFAATAPTAMLTALGVVHPVLLEIDEPLAYEAVEPTLKIRKRVRHPDRPSEPDST